MSSYGTRTRRNADANQRAPPKVFAREDEDGVKRVKGEKRRADGEGPDGGGKGGSKEDKKAAKRARKAAKSALLAQVMGARGTAPNRGQ